jgi:hydroxyacylglutathione hydrolase
LLYEEKAEFIKFMTSGQPSRPANAENIVAINQGKLPLPAELPKPAALDAAGVRAAQQAGALVVDTRSPSEFGANHIPAAYNIQLTSSEFEQRVGWVIPGTAPILLVLEEDHALPAALHALAFIGIADRVTGYLAGGISKWVDAGYRVHSLDQVTVENLYNRLAAEEIQVLDVREEDEWQDGHIEGAVNSTYKRLEESLSSLGLDPNRKTAVVCAGGFRSSTASSILLRAGFTKLLNVTGGMGAWQAAGYARYDGEGNACSF